MGFTVLTSQLSWMVELTVADTKNDLLPDDNAMKWSGLDINLDFNNFY